MARELVGWGMVGGCLVATLAAQMLLRLGVASAARNQPESTADLLSTLRQPACWAGLLCAGIAGVCWIAALARLPLSVAYPVMALSFPLVSVWAWYGHGEPLPPLRLLGLALIVAGACCVGSSQDTRLPANGAGQAPSDPAPKGQAKLERRT